MRCDLLTLFPAPVEAYIGVGVLGRAAGAGLLDIRVHDLRRWAANRYGQVDDEPFGGGPGMVLMASVVVPAVREVQAATGAHVILPDPRGRRFDDALALELSRKEALLFVCGRYEGFDERAHKLLGADEISVGDYVVSGGELPALTILDALARHLPGVVGDPGSVAADSYTSGLLDHPVFTRPRSFEGLEVPEVLCSGNHEAIRKYRLAEAVRLTLERRPDLLAARWGELGEETRRLAVKLARDEGIPFRPPEPSPERS